MSEDNEVRVVNKYIEFCLLEQSKRILLSGIYLFARLIALGCRRVEHIEINKICLGWSNKLESIINVIRTM
jgi:hypothetical protein